jgi:hypothetical protein
VKVYIAGPMTGLPDYNYPAFAAASDALAAAGYEPVSPAGELIDGWEWHHYLRRALQQMLTCEGVALLPGWELSRGARIEKRLAHDLCMPVWQLADLVGAA